MPLQTSFFICLYCTIEKEICQSKKSLLIEKLLLSIQIQLANQSMITQKRFWGILLLIHHDEYKIFDIDCFHFLLLKLGYSNKTNNPNASPSKRMFGLFSCGASVHNETTQNTLLYGIQNIF